MGFPKNFLWGAASAAYQIEGAYDADGKGTGLWDEFARQPGRIAHGENGDIACDHYHRFREDVRLMKEIGLRSYRFSVSWPRLIPGGTGKVNEAGLAFYRELLDCLLEAGIEPLVTLYHWDLPMALFEQGGWKNPQSAEWFAEYAGVVGALCKGKVRYFMTFNEPQLFVGGGLQTGFHAPFEENEDAVLMQVTKNVLLAHGKAVRMLRKTCGADILVGFAPTGACVLPKDGTGESIGRAYRQSFAVRRGEYAGGNAWWSDPIFKGDFPPEAKELFSGSLPEISGDEWKIITEPLDFYGFNIYQADASKTEKDGYDADSWQGSPRTAMGWNITPEAVYWSCRFFYERYGKPLLITENGMACNDFPALDGRVHDYARRDFIQRYLLSLEWAIDEGIPVIGYQYWSVMDNFEWTFGYDKRFGLIYVDYRTQERSLKDSAKWYGQVIASNGSNLKDRGERNDVV